MGNLTPAFSFLCVLSCALARRQFFGLLQDQQQGHLFFIEAGGMQVKNYFFGDMEESTQAVAANSANSGHHS